MGGAGLLGGAAIGSGLLAGCGAQPPAPAAAPAAATAVPCPTCAPVPAAQACPTAAPVAAAAPAAESVEITMLDPTGAQEIAFLFADRLDSLEGKKICEIGVDTVKWQPHRTFPYIEELLKAKYPTIEFIPFTDFTPGLDVNSDEVAEAVKATGCDAVIVGNAG